MLPWYFVLESYILRKVLRSRPPGPVLGPLLVVSPAMVLVCLCKILTYPLNGYRIRYKIRISILYIYYNLLKWLQYITFHLS